MAWAHTHISKGNIFLVNILNLNKNKTTKKAFSAAATAAAAAAVARPCVLGNETLN